MTKEIIKNALEKNLITIETNYGGCCGICCKIGDYAFYFLGPEGDEICVEEYWKYYTIDMTADMLYNILKDATSAEENGIYEDEYNYYRFYLSESE